MKVIFGEKTSTTIQPHGSIRKGISRNDTKHQILTSKMYISEEVKRGHSKNKTATKCFCLHWQKK